MRARVGTSCIKKYGPQYATKPNPAYEEWQKLLEDAESNRDAEQARLEAKHASELIKYNALLLDWENEVASPKGLSRNADRRIGKTQFGTGVISTAFLLVLSEYSIYVVDI